MNPIETPPNIPEAHIIGQSPITSRGIAIWGVPGVVTGAAIALFALREYVPEIHDDHKLTLPIVISSMILAVLGSVIFFYLVKTKGKPGPRTNRMFFVGMVIGAGIAAAVCFGALQLRARQAAAPWQLSDHNFGTFTVQLPVAAHEISSRNPKAHQWDVKEIDDGDGSVRFGWVEFDGDIDDDALRAAMTKQTTEFMQQGGGTAVTMSPAPVFLIDPSMMQSSSSGITLNSHATVYITTARCGDQVVIAATEGSASGTIHQHQRIVASLRCTAPPKPVADTAVTAKAESLPLVLDLPTGWKQTEQQKTPEGTLITELSDATRAQDIEIVVMPSKNQPASDQELRDVTTDLIAAEKQESGQECSSVGQPPFVQMTCKEADKTTHSWIRVLACGQDKKILLVTSTEHTDVVDLHDVIAKAHCAAPGETPSTWPTAT